MSSEIARCAIDACDGGREKLRLLTIEEVKDSLRFEPRSDIFHSAVKEELDLNLKRFHGH